MTYGGFAVRATGSAAVLSSASDVFVASMVGTTNLILACV
jgi:hypothetical protein